MDWKEALDALGKFTTEDKQEGEDLVRALTTANRFGNVPAWYSMLKIARALNCAAWDVEAALGEYMAEKEFESGVVSDSDLIPISRPEWIKKGVIAMVAEQQAMNIQAMATSAPELRNIRGN
jgi:hypothetical protein